MKEFFHVYCIALALIILSACTTRQADNGMIDPGEKIGNFLATTGNEKDTNYLLESTCVDQDELHSTCEANTGEKLNVSYALYNEKNGETLDDVWANHTYKMLIGDQQVNLEAFGIIDAYHTNQFGNPFKMRHWNVWITTDKPGDITIQHSGTVRGEPFEINIVITFVAP
jgi:hypothetical protein